MLPSKVYALQGALCVTRLDTPSVHGTNAILKAQACNIIHDTEGGRGIISLEIFVFKEGGEIFLRRNLGALAVQCVREAV